MVKFNPTRLTALKEKEILDEFFRVIASLESVDEVKKHLDLKEKSFVFGVASGKGGTGKTLVATSLALSLQDRKSVQLLDCDVEEPDAHIFLKPSLNHKQVVFIPIPQVDEAKCTYCGKCREVCEP